MGLSVAAAVQGTCHGARCVQIFEALGDVDEPLQPLLLAVVLVLQVAGSHLRTAMNDGTC